MRASPFVEQPKTWQIQILELPHRDNITDSTDNLSQCGRLKPASLQICRSSGVGEYQPILMPQPYTLSIDVCRVPNIACAGNLNRIDLCAGNAHPLPIYKTGRELWRMQINPRNHHAEHASRSKERVLSTLNFRCVLSYAARQMDQLVLVHAQNIDQPRSQDPLISPSISPVRNAGSPGS